MADDSNRDRQMNLFGTPEIAPRARSRGVGPVEPTEELQETARQLPRNVYLGTSSWSFPGWAGIVYDREVGKGTLARRGLESYARHPLLRAAGIDRTFYAPIPATAFADYASKVPDDFRFLVKAPGASTSPYQRDSAGRSAGANELFLDPTFAAEESVGPFVEGLGPKAGPLVFQFPPLGPKLAGDPRGFAARLGEFLAELPRGPLYAVEVRDRGLLCAEYFEALDASNAEHCLNVHSRMPAVAEQQRARGSTKGPLIVRWMLHSGLVYEEAKDRYEPFDRLVDEDPESRETLAGLSASHVQVGRDVVIIANNKAEGSAPLTVFKLAQSIVGRLAVDS